MIEFSSLFFLNQLPPLQEEQKKEICIQLFESTKPSPVSRLDHAAYLGREFMRAELALVTGQDYVQD